MPTTSELRALAEYQTQGEFAEQHEDEAEGISDQDDVEDESVTEGHPTSGQITVPIFSDVAPTPASTSATATSATMAEQSEVEAGPEVEVPADDEPFPLSKAVGHTRQRHNMNDFSMAFGLFCIRQGVSRKEYSMLKEILALLKSLEGLAKIDTLPDTVDTLKRHVKEELPLMEMRSQSIVLNPDKLPSSRLHAAQVAGKDEVPVQDLFFMNPVDLFKRLLSSQLANEMHFGMAKLVDNPTEAWHSMQWAASIRTTSGDFAYYPPAPDAETTAPRDPIFPGDFIRYKCAVVDCGVCRKENLEDMTKFHQGQVLAVYRDHRTETRRLGNTARSEIQVVESKEGDVVMVIGRLWKPSALLKTIKTHNYQVTANPMKPEDAVPNERILIMDPVEYISSEMAISRAENFKFDYSFDSCQSFEDDVQPTPEFYLIRRVYSRQDMAFIPVGRASPVPGLLEMNEFGRNTLVETFAQSGSRPQVRSLPVMTFTDGFGLYRTMYKSIMGVYNVVAALPKANHGRQINVFPLTLGPHGSNFKDVMKALEPMKALDKGFLVKINGQSVLLCAPVFAFTGDMVQQQTNSGMLSVVANMGCRSCLVPADKRGNLDFNINSSLRGHFETLRQRRAMDLFLTKKQKSDWSSTYGLSLESPAVCEIAPALDLVGGRPSDSAHSEFGGITKMLHQLLIDSAMKPQTVVEYAKVLRAMPFPPGWASIPSPFHVLTYTLEQHARWSILMAVLARCWLREHHLRIAFVRAVKTVFREDMDNGTFGPNATVVDVLIVVITATVRTNCLLATIEMNVDDRDPVRFMETIYNGRRLFQRLCKAAALATSPSGRGGSRATSRAPSRSRGASMTQSDTASTVGVLASVEQGNVEDDINVGQLSVSQKAVKYRQWAARPNVHIGLHYRDVFRRYGLVSLLMVLSGELKHKLWKNTVSQTNHRSPERDLFDMENLLQTLRLTLIDGYKHDEPEITEMIQDLNKSVPTMFATLLPRDDINEEDAEDDNDPSVAVRIVNDERHCRPSALVRLKAMHCKNILGLPVREKEMSVVFRAKLRFAYSIDYNKNIAVIGNQHIKWWKKVSFSSSNKPTARRIVFRRGQYIAYRGDHKGRLDQVFVHEALPGSGDLYLFMVVTPVNEFSTTQPLDPLTKLPIVQAIAGQPLATASTMEDTNQEIIGLPALEHSSLYMVPFTRDDNGLWNFVTQTGDSTTSTDNTDSELLYVDWRIQFT
ncbi:hypothetical protein F5X96DRAFT_560289 [Biscogniauxia mediterranea]|nr:hypothetical protein F5X96DRAFT_560289 [Biscogniauxia mediterranea]